MNSRFILAAAALWAGIGFARADEVPLQAGLARVDITPSMPTPMAGFNNRTCKTALGTLDPIYAKVLVLATGETRVAFVTLDLAGMVSDSLRTRVASELGIPVLLLASSHTHSGPAAGFGRTAKRTPYNDELESKVFNAVKEAAGSMFPARLSAGRGSIQLGYNRLVQDETGRGHTLWVDRNAVAYGPVDPEFMLLRVEDMTGATRALLVHYACHAVVLGPANCKFSPDYPGIMQARVEAAMKGVQCMFVQGGAGDVNPILQGRSKPTDDAQDYAAAVKVGELLAGQVLQSARRIKPGDPNRFPIRSTSEMLTFANRWDKTKSMQVGITTVLINNEFAIAATPGEPMHKLQMAWKANAEVPYPFFWGYTYSAGGDWPGYIPDLRTAAHGGYGADWTTNLEPGAGETILEHHLKNLYGLLGMWHDKPGNQ